MRYVICVPVWGEFFRETWARRVVPSYLAPGNLPFLAATDKIDVLVFTRNEDADWFAEQKWIRLLARVAKVDVVSLPAELMSPDMHLARGEPMQRKYAIHSECVRHAARRYAGEPDVVLITMYGDVLWTAGYCKTIAGALADGHHAVTGASLKVDLGTFGPVLDASIAKRATGAFDPAAICRLSLAHLHTGTTAQIWNSGGSSSDFSQFFWPVGEEGLVSHLVHAHAHAVHLGRIAPGAFEFAGSFDLKFLFLAVPDVSRIAVIEDSMDGFVVEMSSTDYRRADVRDEPWSPERLGAELGNFLGWGLLFDPKTQAAIALTPFRFRHGPCSEAWGRVEAESRAVMRTTLDHIAPPAPAG